MVDGTGHLIEATPGMYGCYALRSSMTDTTCLGIPKELSYDKKHKINIMPKRRRMCLRDQVGARVVGRVFAMAYVARSCLCNAVNAFSMRHAVVQRRPTKALHCPHYLADAVKRAYNPPTYAEWLSKWPKARRNAFNLSERTDLLLPGLVKSFIKREVMLKLTKARLIQGYFNLWTQARCAPEFVGFQKALAVTLSVDTPYEIYPGVFLSMASGANNAAIGRWMDEAVRSHSDCHFIECDGKSWDATMQRDHHKVKSDLMAKCDPQLAHFVDSCFKVVGTVFGDGEKFRYTLDGTVKSGHNDTTSGNTLINGLIHAQACCDMGLKASIIVAGDDMLAVVQGKPSAELYAAEVASYGVNPELRVFNDVSDVSFISGCWLYDRVKHVFCPQLGRLLARLWWTTSPPHGKQLLNYRYSVAVGLYATCAELPMYREFLSDVAGAKLIPIDKHKFSPYVEHVAHGSVMDALQERYSLSAHDINQFRFFLLHARGNFLKHPVADAIMERDLCDIMDRPSKHCAQ